MTNCTVVTIAHRLMSVADFDRIVVMENGQIKEEGDPWSWLAKGDSFMRWCVHAKSLRKFLISSERETIENDVKLVTHKIPILIPINLTV